MVDMNEDASSPEKEKANLQSRLDLVRRLIANQYGIAHHTERYIFDIAKIASIVLGVVFLMGIPQLFSSNSANAILVAISRALATGMAAFAVICVIVIGQAIWSIGGINLNLEAGFKPSLWWYTDQRLSSLKIRNPQHNYDSIMEVHKEIKSELEKEPDEMTMTSESLTFSMLVLRTELQLKVARRMKRVLIGGFFFSVGMALAFFLVQILVP